MCVYNIAYFPVSNSKFMLFFLVAKQKEWVEKLENIRKMGYYDMIFILINYFTNEKKLIKKMATQIFGWAQIHYIHLVKIGGVYMLLIL